MFEPESPLNFTFEASLPFIDKGFYTLNDYPASRISHVMILFIYNHLQLSSHVKKSFKLNQKIKLIWIKGTLSFIHKEKNSKDPLVSWLTALLSFNSHNSGNFHPNDKNEISESKSGSPLSNTRNISEIKQKAFVLLLIKRVTFSLVHLIS